MGVMINAFNRYPFLMSFAVCFIVFTTILFTFFW